MRPSRWYRLFLLVVLAFSLLFGTIPAQASSPQLGGQDGPLPSNIQAFLSVTRSDSTSNLLAGILAIAAGPDHTCALTIEGGVKCWGANSSGQLGNDTTTSRWVPVDVIGLSSGVQAIAAGSRYTCALTTGDAVKCWGANWAGQLGDGTNSDRWTPIDVIGLSSDVQAIAAGSRHTCALSTSGAVKCWGDNSSGQLGDGSTTSPVLPVDVSGLDSNVQAIAAGASHTCALTVGGAVKCWGDNAAGQLGDGTTDGRLTPVDVSGLSNGVQAVTVGDSHTCASVTGGTVKCWGSNGSGRLGDGTTTDHATPVDVSGLNDVQAIVAGADHTCALTTGGAVKCWGANWAGQLGDGATADQWTPIDANGVNSDMQAIAAGAAHTCALTTGGGVKCWGWNRSGQLGNGMTEDRWIPVDVSGLSSGVQAIAAGAGHNCALTAGGGVECWGWNEYGQLGDGTTIYQRGPAGVDGMTSGIEAIAAGGRYTCALTASGGVKCWGANELGQVGDGTTTDRWTPVNVSGLSSGVQAIAAGGRHTCALTLSGGVKCWGVNDAGQLGDGSTTNRLTPVNVSGLSNSIQAIAAGTNHTCALTIGGGVKCWGQNSAGQLGDGTSINRSTPVDVSGLTAGVQAIAAGAFHTCVLTTGGTVKCWGANWAGQLGDGTTSYHWTPADVSGLPSDVTGIIAGFDHSCALAANAVKCWGQNNSGQVGDGTIVNRLTPVNVSGMSTSIQALGAGERHTCALTTDGRVKCWGWNVVGQLGIDSDWTPADVIVGSPLFLPTVAQ